MWRGGFTPNIGAHPPKERQNSLQKHPSACAKLTHPVKGHSLSTTLYQPPESPHAGVGSASSCAETRPSFARAWPELGRGGRRVPDPTASANRKSPFLCPCAGDAGWVQSPRPPAGASCPRQGGAGPKPGRYPPAARGCSEPAGLHCPGAGPARGLVRTSGQDPAPGMAPPPGSTCSPSPGRQGTPRPARPQVPGGDLRRDRGSPPSPSPWRLGPGSPPARLLRTGRLRHGRVAQTTAVPRPYPRPGHTPPLPQRRTDGRTGAGGLPFLPAPLP